ncbi:MAG: GAF domain-containing sensor histidine kinase [Anaerolineales bacterium]|nr:GAF domain-containing sensor histidine kinase [Anaerolineales bacterium]
MLNIESSLLVDRFSISLRWLTLFGLSISMITQESSSLLLQITFLLFALWNISLTIATFLNQQLTALRVVIVIIDLVVANSVFFFSGVLEGSMGWAGLLPLFSATLYFNQKGMLWITLINEISLGAQAFLFSSPLSAAIYVGLSATMYLGIGWLVNYFKQRMLTLVRRNQSERREAYRQKLQAEEEHRRAIFNLISSLSATLNYERVLETVLDMSATALTTSKTSSENIVSAALLYAQDEPGKLHVGSARGFTAADMRISLPGTSGLIGRSIDAASPRLSNNISKDPELGRLVALRDCNSAYVVPLREVLDTYGVLLFCHPDKEYFTPERREVLDIVGNQLMIALQNARLYHDLEIEKERVTKIYEEARNKLARELHDGPTQSVAALAMRTNFTRRLMERDVDAAAEELFKIEDLARRTTKEIRHMLFTLRPLVLESQGLAVALDSLAHNMKDTFDQDVIVDADESIVPKIEMNKQAVIFAIAEEAVNNARKHAEAAHIWVQLKEIEPDIIFLEIKDDGVGFNVQEMEVSYNNRGSLGMVNMRERTMLVNGAVSIESTEGEGTRIQIVIPLTGESADRLRRAL